MNLSIPTKIRNNVFVLFEKIMLWNDIVFIQLTMTTKKGLHLCSILLLFQNLYFDKRYMKINFLS